MALVNCKECGKKISDKASMCPNCGCPTKEENKKQTKENKINGLSIWLVLCSIICFIISVVDMVNLLDLDIHILKIGVYDFHIMSFFAFLLGISYIFLLKNKSKISLYTMIGINIIILLFNIFQIRSSFTFESYLSIFYIICVIANALITTLSIKTHLNNNKLSLKDNKHILALLIIGLIGLLSINLSFGGNYPQTNDRNEDVAQVEITTNYINIRSSQSVDSEILGQVYKGEIYTIISENKESEHKWLEIETSNGIRGYISGIDSYIKRLNTTTNNEEPSQEENPPTNNETPSNNEKPSNNQNTQKPSNNQKPNNSQKPNNNNNSNNNNNNNNNNENYTPQLKACLKTCESGYVLKNEDSVDCYCEKIPVEKTAKEKLIEVMKKNGYTCTSVQCTKSITEYDANLLDYTETFAINFYYQKISLVFVDYRGIHHGKAEIFYGTNTATSEYWLDGTNPDYGKATCSQVFPSLSCSNVGMPSGKKSVNKALDKLNKLLAEANISIDDLKNSK